jgi:hypothetical protein
MNPDPRTAVRYIQALTGYYASAVTLQAFDDRPDKRRELAAVRGGSLSDLWPWVTALQAQGAGVFCTVNATKPGKRTAADVVAIRALFCDFDGVEPPPWHLQPSMVIQSGHGKHAYWLVDGCPVDGFSVAQKRLALHYGSDLKVHDLPRVMRLPGTLHQKDDAPRMVEILHLQREVYPVAVVLEGIAAMPEPPRRPREPERLHPDRVGLALDLRSFDVRRWAEDAGLLLCESKVGGRWYIHCPWSSSHTGGRVTATSTVIFEASAGRPSGFWCSHSGCNGRTIRDVRDTLDDAGLAAYCWPTDPRRVARADAYAAEIARGLPWMS